MLRNFENCLGEKVSEYVAVLFDKRSLNREEDREKGSHGEISRRDITEDYFIETNCVGIRWITVIEVIR